jgi:aminodeoxyfutalosine synthase
MVSSLFRERGYSDIQSLIKDGHGKISLDSELDDETRDHLKSLANDLKMYAISRLYLDNFPHIKAYWPMLGRQTAQLTLSYGVNDIDGTIDDTTKIYSMAGSEEQTPAMTTQELVSLIKQVNRKPIERGTLYNVIQDYSNYEFAENE